MADLTIYQFNGTHIRIRPIDRYVCLTDMAKASGKLFADWNRLKSTVEFLQELSATMGIPIDKLLEVEEGKFGGTWGHPQVAIDFGKWCSVGLRVKVTGWIDELLTKGSVSIRNVQPAIVPEQQLALTASSVRDLTESIGYYEAQGNLKLSQQLKHVLSYQLDRIAPMNALPAASVDRTEGAVDVAIRLGIRVPSNLEGTLGQYVKRQCGWLIQGKDSRISLKTGKNVPANQYPYGNTEVEQAVLGFCEQKGLI